MTSFLYSYCCFSDEDEEVITEVKVIKSSDDAAAYLLSTSEQVQSEGREEGL